MPWSEYLGPDLIELFDLETDTVVIARWGLMKRFSTLPKLYWYCVT